jgi:hypothetical protein
MNSDAPPVDTPAMAWTVLARNPERRICGSSVAVKSLKFSPPAPPLNQLL